MSLEDFKRAAVIERSVKMQKDFWNNRRSIVDLCSSGTAFGPFKRGEKTEAGGSYKLEGIGSFAGFSQDDQVGIVSPTGEFVGTGKYAGDEIISDYVLPEQFFLTRQPVFTRTIDYDSLPQWPDGSKLNAPANFSPVPSRYTAGMDPVARQAFEGVTALNYMFGVKGPPGTGKTTLIGRAIAYLSGVMGKRVLILANAHKAVDEALLDITESRHRFGLSFDVIKKTSKVRQFRQSALNGACKLWGAKDYELPEAGCVVGAVLASTFQEKYQYDLVVIDEAGQVPLFLGAKVAGLASSFAFFGDNSQLPPILEAQHEEHVKRSCLTYLMDNDPTGSHVVELEVTHRLPERLASVVGNHFYPSLRFRPSENNRRSTFDAPREFPTRENLGVIRTSNDTSTNVNEEEADIVYDLVSRLIGRRAIFDRKSKTLSPEDIAVLTPFKMQERLLLGKLSKTGVKTIGTVDIMQGQSKAVVIFCTTSTDPKYIGTCAHWLFEPNRINVGISRAKAGCYVVVNPVSLERAIPATAAGIVRLEQAKQVIADFCS